MGWYTLASAPLDGRDIDILTAGGFELRARYERQGFINEAGDDCGGWVSSEEDKHPPCWTDGVCWGSNEDESPSDPPIMWRPAHDR
ncbi:hypothetical protein [Bosea sp. NPDC055594]